MLKVEEKDNFLNPTSETIFILFLSHIWEQETKKTKVKKLFALNENLEDEENDFMCTITRHRG